MSNKIYEEYMSGIEDVRKEVLEELKNIESRLDGWDAEPGNPNYMLRNSRLNRHNYLRGKLNGINLLIRVRKSSNMMEAQNSSLRDFPIKYLITTDDTPSEENDTLSHPLQNEAE